MYEEIESGIKKANTLYKEIESYIEKINDALNYYVDTIESYFSAAHEIADIVLWTLLLFEIIFIGIRMILGEYTSLQSIVKKILFLGAWIYVIQNIDTLAIAFADTLKLMGMSIHNYSFDYLENPLDLLGYAYSEVFFHFIKEIKGMLSVSLWNILNIIVPLLMLILVFICMIVSFGIIVILLCLIKIEFYFLLLMAILLIPFHINEQTRFISTKSVSVVIFQGIRLLSISLVTGLVIESFKKVISETMGTEGFEIPFVLIVYLILHMTLGLYLIIQSGSIIQAFMPGASSGASPLQQMATIAGAALAATTTVMGGKAVTDMIGSKAKGMLDSAKGKLGGSGSASKKNNIPKLPKSRSQNSLEGPDPE